MDVHTDVSAKLFADACAVIPGGVNSPVRAFKAVGGTPRFITEAHGCWLTDADGRQPSRLPRPSFNAGTSRFFSFRRTSQSSSKHR